MSVRIYSKWITCPRPAPLARLRLFCLPFAGGGASAYRLWPAALPSWIEVCPIQLPGREDRYREPAFTSVTGLCGALARELEPYLDLPFVIFGHSMGALLAFEVTRTLRRVGAPAPQALLLAAYPPPHNALARNAIHHLPDAEFIDQMRRMQGTPEAVLQNADLMSFMLPILRADFQACDTYAWVDAPPLTCPIHMYGGEQDHEVAVTALEGWRRHTLGDFSVRVLPGSHFFVQAHRDMLLSDIVGRLSALPV
jgi:medium-chain acyl-[acyl-carrier-protein] hydrolase